MFSPKSFSLDDIIFRWTKKSQLDVFTLRHAVRGLMVMGTIGSGKSSGIGDWIADKYIKSGFGGIVLCAKVGEADEWRRRARLANAEKRFVFFSKNDFYRFSPLLYEMSRTDEGGQNTDVMTDLFMRLSRLGNRMRGGSGRGSNDPFWDLVLERLVKAMLDVLKLAKEPVTVNNMVRLLSSIIGKGNLNKTFEQYCLEKDFFDEVIAELEEKNKKLPDTEKLSDNDIKAEALKKIKFPDFPTWKSNYLINCLYKIKRTYLSTDDALIYEVAKQLFLYDFPSFDQKLRVSIRETFYAFANPFRSGLLHKYFGSSLSSEIMPERTFEGKIIVLDFPVHRYGILGSYAQVLYKKQWQDCVQRRKINDRSVPVFQYVDECQFFLDDADMLFATTARSAKACNVFLTQNLSNLYATIGNNDRVHSLLGNLTTKCFHNNDSVVTNEWASKTISDAKKSTVSGSLKNPEMLNISENYVPQIRPQDFLSLKNGGKDNQYIVEGYLTRVGRPFSNGKNFIKMSFPQRPFNA